MAKEKTLLELAKEWKEIDPEIRKEIDCHLSDFANADEHAHAQWVAQQLLEKLAEE